MNFPLFYRPGINAEDAEVMLDEAASKHIVQVLRMQQGEQLQLTDGVGNVFTTKIIDDNRKKCRVNILHTLKIAQRTPIITIAISPLKNTSRFEWFLEKATEIGVSIILPLLCERTEKQHLKRERMQGILISAMLQSQQAWLPVLSEPIKFTKFLPGTNANENSQKMIAHCEDDNNKILLQHHIKPSLNKLILIGPEGDFKPNEIDLALQHSFEPVSLGNTRLRTETAGIVAATMLCNF